MAGYTTLTHVIILLIPLCKLVNPYVSVCLSLSLSLPFYLWQVVSCQCAVKEALCFMRERDSQRATLFYWKSMMKAQHSQYSLFLSFSLSLCLHVSISLSLPHSLSFSMSPSLSLPLPLLTSMYYVYICECQEQEVFPVLGKVLIKLE